MRKRKSLLWPVHVALALAVAFFVFPFLWMGLTSFKSFPETIKLPLIFFPAKWQFSNYVNVFNRFPILNWYGVTFAEMALVIPGQILIAAMAAYAFARIRFPGREAIFLICLSIMMIPEQIFIIPRYNIIVKMGLMNTMAALVLPKLAAVFSTFMLRQFFMSLPHEMDEAAKIDGCGHFSIFSRILMPMLKTPLLSLAILIGISVWKELMWPIIIINTQVQLPLSAGLSLLADEYNSQYQFLMVGGMMGSIPVILLFFILQRWLVEGIALQGMKA